MSYNIFISYVLYYYYYVLYYIILFICNVFFRFLRRIFRSISPIDNATDR